MSKRPELSADMLGLVKKGEGIPSHGLPQRGAELTTPPPAAAAKEPRTAKTGKSANTEQMIFRVSPAFSLEFRRYAVEHRMKLNEVFEKAFETLKRQDL